jgi:hypothetical protein
MKVVLRAAHPVLIIFSLSACVMSQLDGEPNSDGNPSMQGDGGAPFDVEVQSEALTAAPSGLGTFGYMPPPGVVSSIDKVVKAVASPVVGPAGGGARIAWAMVGTVPGAYRIAGCYDGSIYMLKTDKTIWRNATFGRDGSWTKVGTVPLTDDLTCSDRLWAFNSDRTLYRNDGTPTSLSWTYVGNPYGAKQVSSGWTVPGTRLAPGLFALNDDNSIWQSTTGADGSWTRIGQPVSAARISAGRTGIWVSNEDRALYRGNGVDTGWTYIETPGGAASISDDGFSDGGALWALNDDNTLWHGLVRPQAVPVTDLALDWTKVGKPTFSGAGNATKIAGCADGLIFALDNARGLWRNSSGGKDAGWSYVTSLQSLSAIDIMCSDRLWYRDSGNNIYFNNGTPSSPRFLKAAFVQNTMQVVTGWGIGATQPALFSLNSDQTLSQSTSGTSWSNVGQPTQAMRIAAARDGLWALNYNRDLYRGNGTDSGWVWTSNLPNAREIVSDSSMRSGALWRLDSNGDLFHGVVKSGPHGIEYNGAHIMPGASAIYYLWYGTWASSTKSALTTFASNLSGPYWNINATYSDRFSDTPSSVMAYGGAASDAYSNGKNLDTAQLKAILQKAVTSKALPGQTEAIYVVMAASDVTAPNYCQAFCAYHSSMTLNDAHGEPFFAKFALVLDPGSRCNCNWGVSSTPNGVPVDSMASMIAHEAAEAVTDPFITAWWTPASSGPVENADLCVWKTGTTFRTSSGATANVTLGARDYLLQTNWLNVGEGSCSTGF